MIATNRAEPTPTHTRTHTAPHRTAPNRTAQHRTAPRQGIQCNATQRSAHACAPVRTNAHTCICSTNARARVHGLVCTHAHTHARTSARMRADTNRRTFEGGADNRDDRDTHEHTKNDDALHTACPRVHTCTHARTHAHVRACACTVHVHSHTHTRIHMHPHTCMHAHALSICADALKNFYRAHATRHSICAATKCNTTQHDAAWCNGAQRGPHSAHTPCTAAQNGRTQSTNHESNQTPAAKISLGTEISLGMEISLGTEISLGMPRMVVAIAPRR